MTATGTCRVFLLSPQKGARTPQGEVAVPPRPALWSGMLRENGHPVCSSQKAGGDLGVTPGGDNRSLPDREMPRTRAKPRAPLLGSREEEPEEVTGARAPSQGGRPHTGWGMDPATRPWAFVPEIDIMSL